MAGDRSVTLTWTNPNDASIAVYQYQVNHNATGTGRLSGWSAWQNVPGSGASTASHTFSGLKNGSEYRYKIRAAKEWIEDQYITQVATERHELLRSNTGNPNPNPYGGRSPWTKKL